MKTPSSYLSTSLALSRYVSGLPRSKLMDSIKSITVNNASEDVRVDFKKRLINSINKTEAQIKTLGSVKRGEKRKAQKLIRLLTNNVKYQYALSLI